jgi:hypothetical protein
MFFKLNESLLGLCSGLGFEDATHFAQHPFLEATGNVCGDISLKMNRTALMWDFRKMVPHGLPQTCVVIRNNQFNAMKASGNKVLQKVPLALTRFAQSHLDTE